jgi:23S rRNA pseudouridine1911/1915/1917 synthase
LVNGKAGRASLRLREGDRLVVELDAAVATPVKPEPQAIPLEILYADEDVIVLNKPSGLVVHPGAGNREGTLANSLLALYPEIDGVGPEERPGIVHRLDKGTSGVMVAARSSRAHASLVGQFRRHDVRKTYVGPSTAGGRAKGTSTGPSAGMPRRGRGSRSIRRTPDADLLPGHRGLSEGDPLEISGHGRTHQIRVHLPRPGT